MTLKVEVAARRGLAAKLADSMRDVTKLRADIELVAPGSPPNDGKVIEDARKKLPLSSSAAAAGDSGTMGASRHPAAGERSNLRNTPTTSPAPRAP